MEDDLNISKVEYLSNHLWDPTKISNLTLDDQITLYTFFKWRPHPMKDNLQLKTTSKYQKWNISVPTCRIILKFKTYT